MGVSSEDSSGGFSLPKSLSVWWNEETDYVLQRIERWAAYARGYNRLRSVRLSPGRMTMQQQQQQQQRDVQRRPEQTRLSCCALGNLNYKSNGNLDTSCLEAYSLDHSIYFKTIGEIRGELCRSNNNNATTESQQQQQQQQPRTTPLDCGDFLSSDFDDEDEELAVDDAADYDLRQQLDQLELGCNVYAAEQLHQEVESEEQRPVVQLCRSQLNEDEINNNIMMMGFQRKFAVAAAAQ